MSSAAKSLQDKEEVGAEEDVNEVEETSVVEVTEGATEVIGERIEDATTVDSVELDEAFETTVVACGGTVLPD